jgi:hypothetical protein
MGPSSIRAKLKKQGWVHRCCVNCQRVWVEVLPARCFGVVKKMERLDVLKVEVWCGQVRKKEVEKRREVDRDCRDCQEFRRGRRQAKERDLRPGKKWMGKRVKVEGTRRSTSSRCEGLGKQRDRKKKKKREVRNYATWDMDSMQLVAFVGFLRWKIFTHQDHGMDVIVYPVDC